MMYMVYIVYTVYYTVYLILIVILRISIKPDINLLYTYIDILNLGGNGR